MRRLIVLPWKKSVEIAYKSIRARFFRSLVTTLTLVLAVSFLSFSQVSIDIADKMLATGDPSLCQMLMRCGYDILPGDTSLAASPKQRWIITLSLLVCVVGIINAQLMSVTERFREIGTMKCLGALDRFIVRLFVMEAAMQGFAGASFGAVLGGISAFLAALFRFGPDTISLFPWQAIFVSVSTAFVTGIGLSLLGVLYPAIIAARMQPVEAMRVEQ
ncbi:MAG: FtsX-like permease family protein [Proteobacteria bacterium]|nr:FtsX-like permease family protein [Pseudomonadota bacterium]MBU1417782.1 FtsX-like permease family protein [Pseudomonadota bacterium]MBU1453480.1 FtsX-like permease family protein [Pseudomonadota bacterium]